ncbi:Methyltransferase-like protein 25 [Fulvia fulva]|uniref:Methyltransferase-like protein 25 n=1 Tax=Passalora fulva TaxID=5499 RepID=A0A9Q8PA64_PASFU|nr:Methyltransferase-like protein 25 [Fulvia fulva]KAK4621934.1 Methyltransferase-like protein 25 [Fulvia fulva]KAK4622366.1 Methyltransferase-like protein 25 [Fulvia fulva]UJO18705.1 Methyltransferase-like protein 25 [Fulvia fulva]WPV16346.1 Methyltransferase-like protein 25 [Fulvia fulva]WPV31416.1 Methyltransferase-like protein 25 [Fulvia fulva]
MAEADPRPAMPQEKIGPENPLPHTDAFSSTAQYVDSLLDFVGTNGMLRNLCGGVHILDFFTSTPSLYSRILPQDWRDFFTAHDVMDILDLLMREDLSTFNVTQSQQSPSWRDGPLPPETLLDYIRTVRKHLLDREPGGSQCSRNRAMKPTQKLARHVAVGMNVKKVHEVGLFAWYLNKLTTDIAQHKDGSISHLVDFGSGQNYLGRALASEPYNQNIIAVESKQANAERAKELDVFAKLTEKQKLMRNKKAFREGREGPGSEPEPKPVAPVSLPTPLDSSADDATSAPTVEVPTAGSGKIQYVEHRIQDGDLSGVISSIPASKTNLMVMSLHSCGNLVHHGLRSLLLNDEVKAVAMVGCCYNLVTERLGPATYKLPELRPTTHEHPRLAKAGEACDPHGFPMSSRLCNYYNEDDANNSDKGVRLNITSRMMAVQAPGNWGPKDSESFFTRHFYRALLQRIFMDRGVVSPPTLEGAGSRSPAGHSSGGTPIVIGSLRKSCYDSFTTYVRGALEKLTIDSEQGDVFKEKMGDITDLEIENYEKQYQSGKKDLSVIWSLMAFSAGVIEATIVVDRWLWLKEQDAVQEAWVEPVFDYKFSPRNLVVVGIQR